MSMNKIIAERISALADVIQADSDYVYDPQHQNRPHGGGTWYKTEKGWSTYKNQDMKNTDSGNPEISKVLKDSTSDSWVERSNAASSKYATPEVLDKLSKDEDFSVRESVASNQNTPRETLDRLSQDKNDRVRGKVAKNPQTSIEVLKVLSKDEENDVRWQAASNPSMPPDILDELSKDQNNVRWEVAANPATNQSTLRELAQDEIESVSQKALKMLKIKRQPESYARGLAEKGDADAQRYLKYKEKIAR